MCAVRENCVLFVWVRKTPREEEEEDKNENKMCVCVCEGAGGRATERTVERKNYARAGGMRCMYCGVQACVFGEL